MIKTVSELRPDDVIWLEYAPGRFEGRPVHTVTFRREGVLVEFAHGASTIYPEDTFFEVTDPRPELTARWDAPAQEWVVTVHNRCRIERADEQVPA